MRTIKRMMGGAALLLGIAAGPAAPERVVTGDWTVAATVAGQPARLLVDPAAPGSPILSPAFAARAGLTPGMISARVTVGPVKVNGTSAVRDIAVGSGSFKRRVFWFDRPLVPEVDGVIGPSALPDSVVRFSLRAPAPGDRTVTLPMVDGGGMFGGIFGLYGLIEVGGQPVRIRFDLRHRRTVATAGAGTVVAAANGGTLEGASQPVEIAFGVERPVRRMRLARPLAIGPFKLPELGVRVSDYGSAGTIPDADRAADPDEIVVVGRKKRNPERDQIRLGRDWLDSCASLVFDKPAKQVRLTCG